MVFFDFYLPRDLWNHRLSKEKEKKTLQMAQFPIIVADGSPFPIENIPFGIFSLPGSEVRLLHFLAGGAFKVF